MKENRQERKIKVNVTPTGENVNNGEVRRWVKRETSRKEERR